MLTRHYIKPYQLLAIIGVVNYVIMYTIGWVMAGTIISGILLLLVAVPLIYQYCNKQQLGIMRVSLSTYDTHPQSYSKTAELEISDT